MPSYSLLWHWTSNPSADLPAWAQDRDMFIGQYVSPGNYPTIMNSATPGQSGKVTNGFLKALCRATMIMNGCDTDGWAHNQEFSFAEVTLSNLFEGNVVGTGEIACVVYKKSAWKFLGEQGGRTIETNKSSFPFFMAIWSMLCEDIAFDNAFQQFVKSVDTDEKKATACLLANIAYLKTKDGGTIPCSASDVTRLSSTQMNRPAMAPDEYYGNFQRFSVARSSGGIKRGKTKPRMATKDFVGAFKFYEGDLPEDLQDLVPKLDEKYIVGHLLVTLCEHFKVSTSFPNPIRNVLLRGEPGTGKTAMYMGVAAGCGLPLYSQAAHAMMEPFDFFGQFIPEGEGTDKHLKRISLSEVLNGITYLEDIVLDPTASFQKITGQRKDDASEMDCISAAFALANQSLNTGQSGQQRFKFVPGQLVYAMKYGGVFGFDEINLPQNPGVIPALNSAMDGTQSITLPNGEIVKRHPNCIFISTTNVDLEGCRRINQAWQDVRDVLN